MMNWVIVGEKVPLHALDTLAIYCRNHYGNSWLINIDFNNSNNNGSVWPERSNLISKADPLQNDFLDAEEYQVFSALIEEVFLGSKNRSIPVFIRDCTDLPESIVSNLIGSQEGQNQEALQDFKAKNSHGFKLKRMFDLKASTNKTILASSTS